MKGVIKIMKNYYVWEDEERESESVLCMCVFMFKC